MLAILYLIPYLLCGVLIAEWLLPRVRPLNRLWLGLSLGVLLMMWLPALFAFALRFSRAAHMAAWAALAVLTAGAWAARDRREPVRWDREEWFQLLAAMCVAVPLTVLFAYLQYTHVYRPDATGGWSVGQSTYGDLPMHTAFIAGMRNAAFPPEYTMYPGHRLTYPFLTDSLSTSFCLFGLSLQAATIVPAVLMFFLTCLGVMTLTRELTVARRAAVVAALLFFLNGGLGFLYNFDQAAGFEADGTLKVAGRLNEIMTGYYATPTNQPEPNNLRWSNLIADLFVPQRTLLGGYSMVIPCFYLLWTLHADRQQPWGGWRQTLLLGLWAGALPLIHTHSFLALALCSAGFLTYDMIHGPARLVRLRHYAAYVAVTVTLAAPQLIRFTFLQSLGSAPETTRNVILLFAAVLAQSAALLFPEDVVHGSGRRRKVCLPLMITAGTAALLLAALAGWFTLTGPAPEKNERFLNLHFNWVNNLDDGTGMRDFYLWFYVKNIGLPILLVLLAWLEKNPRHRRILYGAGFIWLAAELVVFQPNHYDNNKLLYLAWLLMACVAADYFFTVFAKLKGLRSRWPLAILLALVTFLSAGLTLCREVVSDYQAFDVHEVAAAEYIDENTPEGSVFLTGNQHLNPVDSIAGRSVVCGPDLWLYWHGFDTREANADVRSFYAMPSAYASVLDKYGVDYVYVSPDERYNYVLDEAGLDRLLERVYDREGIVIWKVPEG